MVLYSPGWQLSCSYAWERGKKGRETCLYHFCTHAILGLLTLWGLGLQAVPKLRVSSSSSTVHIPQHCSLPIAWRMLCMLARLPPSCVPRDQDHWAHHGTCHLQAKPEHNSSLCCSILQLLLRSAEKQKAITVWSLHVSPCPPCFWNTSNVDPCKALHYILLSEQGDTPCTEAPLQRVCDLSK